ncbi:MAG: pre-peptidase C-terminal domain-containing protein [Chloroflexi bacterium]|nr:pre-peptidase C-terminal domain-containing protein [Chloroflexota bacterium]
MGNRKFLRPLVIVSALVLFVMSVSAQDNNRLELGVPVIGEISSDVPAQVYTLVAAAGDIVNVGATSQPGLALQIVVTDAAGNQLASALGTVEGGGATALNVPLAQGTNYIVVFAGAGSTTQGGQFRILADAASGSEPAATPEPAPTAAATLEPITPPVVGAVNDGFQLGQVLTASGLEVTLDWSSTADLNLELRDPTGQRLFFDSRTNQNGGSFGFDVNGLCEVLSSPAQETAEYSPGAIPVGSYEILVYYRQNCENNGAQPFTVNVTVDGIALPAIIGTLQPPATGVSSVFISSFIVNTDGTAVAGASGPYQDTRVIPQTLSNELASAQKTELVDGFPARGVINGSFYYDLYTFTGTANQVVAISMTRQSGNLDTLLLVLDPNNQIISDNDDIVAGNVTDSAINNPPLRLPVDGQYTVIATRYGKDVGGTAGEYDILLQTQTTALPQDIVDLGLPTGDIQMTLVWNTNADLQLLVRDPSGQAVYDDRLTVPSGGRMFAQGNLNCVAALTTPVSHIYWPTGLGRGGSYEVEVWYQNQCADTRAVNATLYISVAGQQVAALPITPSLNDRYVTSFVIESTGQATLGAGGIVGGSETLNFNAELEGAPVIAPNQIVRGSIDQNNKFDVYVFEGTAGQVVNIRMERTQGALDTSLYLISPSFFEVAANDDAVVGTTTDSLIAEFALPESGRYIVLATHFATIYGGTIGTYQLSMTLQ